MMGPADFIAHENRPAPPVKKESGFSPLEDMNNYVKRQNNRLD